MRRTAFTTLALAAAVAAVAGHASGYPPARRAAVTRIGEFSSQLSGSRAVAGAWISVGARPVSPGGSGAPAAGGAAPAAAAQVPPPSLAPDSPLLRDPAPAGPGSLWYQGPSGLVCIYIPNASPDCFAITRPALAAPPDYAALAAGLAERLDLSLAAIEASPAASRAGLVGAPSWFWLAEAPHEVRSSITLGGESVTVSAVPAAISWSFGDGAGTSAGAGTPYRTGAPPADAVTHLYETRCLPGDQGRDPYVLASCAADGYHVGAATSWTISFSAAGPVGEGGQLPSRTTASTLVYPVSEARAFLTGGQG